MAAGRIPPAASRPAWRIDFDSEVLGARIKRGLSSSDLAFPMETHCNGRRNRIGRSARVRMLRFTGEIGLLLFNPMGLGKPRDLLAIVRPLSIWRGQLTNTQSVHLNEQESRTANHRIPSSRAGRGSIDVQIRHDDAVQFIRVA